MTPSLTIKSTYFYICKVCRNTKSSETCRTRGTLIYDASSFRLFQLGTERDSHRLLCVLFNPLTPNDAYSGRTAPLTSKRYILYIYSTNTGTEYFKHGIYCPFFSLQNTVCFIILTYLVPVLFTFYIQGVLKLKKVIPATNG